MKRFLKFLAYAMIAVCLTTSCSKDDDDDKKTSSTNQEQNDNNNSNGGNGQQNEGGNQGNGDSQNNGNNQNSGDEGGSNNQSSSVGTLFVTLYDATTGTYPEGATVVVGEENSEKVVAILVSNSKGEVSLANLDKQKSYILAIVVGDVNYETKTIKLTDDVTTFRYTYKSAKLNIVVKDKEGILVSGATVTLYEKEDAYKNGDNYLDLDQKTNSQGKVSYENLKINNTYYFSVVNGAQTNATGVFKTVCVEGETDVVVVIEEPTGILKLNNDANYDKGRYKYIITNESTQEKRTYIIGIDQYENVTLPVGKYSVYMEQLDGYRLWATTGTKSVNLQNGKTVELKTSDL